MSARKKNAGAVSLGRKGGKAGTGAAKARSSAVAKATALKRWANYTCKPGPSNAAYEPRDCGEKLKP